MRLYHHDETLNKVSCQAGSLQSFFFKWGNHFCGNLAVGLGPPASGQEPGPLKPLLNEINKVQKNLIMLQDLTVIFGLNKMSNIANNRYFFTFITTIFLLAKELCGQARLPWNPCCKVYVAKQHTYIVAAKFLINFNKYSLQSTIVFYYHIYRKPF